MALLNCRVCKGTVSARATTCPHCGEAGPTTSALGRFADALGAGFLKLVGGILILGFVLGLGWLCLTAIGYFLFKYQLDHRAGPHYELAKVAIAKMEDVEVIGVDTNQDPVQGDPDLPPKTKVYPVPYEFIPHGKTILDVGGGIHKGVVGFYRNSANRWMIRTKSDPPFNDVESPVQDDDPGITVHDWEQTPSPK